MVHLWMRRRYFAPLEEVLLPPAGKELEELLQGVLGEGRVMKKQWQWRATR